LFFMAAVFYGFAVLKTATQYINRMS